MRFIELFAGIGGFRYGLERVCFQNEGQSKRMAVRGQNRQPNEQPDKCKQRQFTCVWANEIDKYACQIYRKNFREGELYEGDITKVNADDIPDYDLLCGGFPCQAFSIAGKRLGFNDTRGTLFFEIARILKAKRPKYLILENVKGLLSHDNGRTFKAILSTLDELGYDLQWQVLNSKDFGVPQNRERVFIVGHFRGERRPEVFPVGEGCQEASQLQGLKVGAITARRGNAKADGDYIVESNRQALQVIKKSYYDDVHFLGKLPKIRRLTPTECERLQGFPDGWTEGVSDTQRYKCLGNAVTTNVITEIGKRLRIGR